MWVHSILHLEERVQQQQIEPKQVQQRILITEVHEKDFSLKCQLHQADLLIILHLISINLFLLVKISKIFVIFIASINKTHYEKQQQI